MGESEGGGDRLGGVLEGEGERNAYDARGVVRLVFETLNLLTILSVHCFLLIGLLSCCRWSQHEEVLECGVWILAALLLLLRN